MSIEILEFYLLQQHSLLFRLLPSDSTPTMVKLSVGREKIASLVENLLMKIRNRLSTHQESYEIFSLLLGQIMFNVEENRSHLIIIPHGELHHLPFSCLWTGNDFLGNRFLISQIPSLQTLTYIRERVRETESQCLSVGTAPEDPIFVQSSFEGEATEVANLFESTPIIGQEASKETIAPLISKTEILHFVTHGRFVQGNALDSGLKLYPSSREAKKNENGKKITAQDILMARDFFKLGLDANLVVLSSCQTGLNDIHPGDELEGLTQSIIYAGAASIMVSLWSINTTATREFMRKFYEVWKKNNKTKVQALQQAQKHLQALTLFQICEIIQSKVTTNDDAESLRIQVELGNIFSLVGLLKESKIHYSAALEKAEEMNLPLDSYLIKNKLAHLLMITDESRLGRSYLESLEKDVQYKPMDSQVRDSYSFHTLGLKQEIVELNERRDESLFPWASPYFWAPFCLLGDWE